jgi:hypothetical protein
MHRSFCLWELLLWLMGNCYISNRRLLSFISRENNYFGLSESF